MFHGWKNSHFIVFLNSIWCHFLYKTGFFILTLKQFLKIKCQSLVFLKNLKNIVDEKVSKLGSKNNDFFSKSSIPHQSHHHHRIIGLTRTRIHHQKRQHIFHTTTRTRITTYNFTLRLRLSQTIRILRQKILILTILEKGLNLIFI